MRIVVALLAAVLLLAVAPSAGRAASCPANATTASFAVWPENSIPTGSSVSGTHPCGRRLACIGGVTGRKATRRCRWL